MSGILSKISDCIRTICKKSDRIQPTSAIILASGNSTRMGGVSKQTMLLSGTPVIARTLCAFDECEYIDEIILVAREEDFSLCRELQREYKFKKLTRLVGGGATRQISARNGFSAISKKSKFVAIHDGARCLITSEQIAQVCRAAYKTGAASAATRAIDSVKLTNGKNLFIASSAQREHIWLAQTPQIFRAETYELALKRAEDDGLVVTDDNSLVENLGVKIKLVECGRTNIKITSPEDVPLAEAIISTREGEK